MDMLTKSFVSEAGDIGMVMDGLSNDTFWKHGYRPLGYGAVMPNLVVQVGLYYKGKDTGKFTAFWSPSGTVEPPKKNFKGSFMVGYRKTKRVGGEITVNYSITKKGLRLDSTEHVCVQFD